MVSYGGDRRELEHIAGYSREFFAVWRRMCRLQLLNSAAAQVRHGLVNHSYDRTRL